MKTKTIPLPVRRRLLLLAAASFCLFVVLPTSQAQQKRQREQPPERDRIEAPREEDREAGPLGRDRRDRDGAPEGVPDGPAEPQARIAPPGQDVRPHLLPRRWVLGVHAYSTQTGVVITDVVPRSPAWRAGLEPRDVIVTIDGYQVGYVNDQPYHLGDELQHRAGRDGRVRLLVQNWRNNELVNLDVTLRRGGDIYPSRRER